MSPAGWPPEHTSRPSRGLPEYLAAATIRHRGLAAAVEDHISSESAPAVPLATAGLRAISALQLPELVAAMLARYFGRPANRVPAARSPTYIPRPAAREITGPAVAKGTVRISIR